MSRPQANAFVYFVQARVKNAEREGGRAFAGLLGPWREEGGASDA